MIYELAVVAKSGLSDDEVASITGMVGEVVGQYKGKLLTTDDWGRRIFSQPASDKTPHGRFLYYVFQSEDLVNDELIRKLKINDGVMRQMIIKVGNTEADGEEFVKKIKTPYSKKYPGSVADEADGDGNIDRDRKRFVRKKSCWFAAKNIVADWKDPKTYNWLVSDFGKIAPSRVSGINRKNQKLALKAIKRARNIGIASYISSAFAE